MATRWPGRGRERARESVISQCQSLHLQNRDYSRREESIAVNDQSGSIGASGAILHPDGSNQEVLDVRDRSGWHLMGYIALVLLQNSTFEPLHTPNLGSKEL